MSVLVGVPIKNAAIWLPRFLEQLDKLSDVSRVVFICGPCRDDTYPQLWRWGNDTRHPVEIFDEPTGMNALSAAQIGAVYKDFQDLMREDEDETHFLLIDSDIMDVPPDLIQLLKRQDKDIVAPYVWVDRANPPQFFDVDCFRLNGFRFHPFLPPDPGKSLMVDSVGSCYLAKREPFLACEYGNPHPHMIFCGHAIEAGYEVWADPRIKIQHLDSRRVGVVKTPLEILQGKPHNPPPFIKKDGSVVTNEEFVKELINVYVWGRVE